MSCNSSLFQATGWDQQCTSTGAVENAESSSWGVLAGSWRAQSFCDAKYLNLQYGNLFCACESFMRMLLENNYIFSRVAAKTGQKKKVLFPMKRFI